MSARHLSSSRQAQTATPRRLSPSARPLSGVSGMLTSQIRAEFVQNVRVLEFLVGIVVFPIMLYAMFGLPNAGQTALWLVASFAFFGVLALVGYRRDDQREFG